jgi:ketosteroid isomerase-like protein
VGSAASNSSDERNVRAHDDFFRSVYDHFNDRDIEWLLDRMTSDVEWPNVRAGTQLLGHDAVRDYWHEQWSTIDPRVRPIGITQRSDGRIDVEVHQVIREVQSGVVIAEQVVHHLYELRDGKVASMQVSA